MFIDKNYTFKQGEWVSTTLPLSDTPKEDYVPVTVRGQLLLKNMATGEIGVYMSGDYCDDLEILCELLPNAVIPTNIKLMVDEIFDLIVFDPDTSLPFTKRGYEKLTKIGLKTINDGRVITVDTLVYATEDQLKDFDLYAIEWKLPPASSEDSESKEPTMVFDQE